MKLEIMRYSSDSDSTGGLLLVDGKFFCFTCEDEKREVKIPGETRIPGGTYRITLRDEGGKTKKYAERYDFHQGMLWLRNVPGFEWVYIHTGNTDDDSLGCILVGYGANRSGKENTISRSRDAYTDLYKLILAAIAAGEQVLISIWEISK
jgi:hypothetical protein